MSNKLSIYRGNELSNYASQLLNQMDNLQNLPTAKWDSKRGFWTIEPDGEIVDKISFGLVGIANVWACWSEEIGVPYCYDIGPEESPCTNDTHNPTKGMRIIGIYDSFPVAIDAFGLMHQYFALGVLKRVALGETFIEQSGSREVKTKHGTFILPKLMKKEKVDASE